MEKQQVRQVAATQLPLRALALLSLAVPLLIYSALAAFRYSESMDSAEHRVSRSLRVTHEHATRVLAGAEAIQDRIFDLVNGRTQAELRARAKEIHDALVARTSGQKQLQSLWVIGADGRPIASSQVFPAPEFSLADRAYFQHHRAGGGGRFLSEPITTRLRGDRILDFSIRFNGPDGSFGGTINISLFTSYFAEFYSDLAAQEPGLAVNLFHAEGPIYTRWPALKDAPDRLGKSSPVLQRVRAGESSGRLRGVSSVDGQDRLLSFAQVGDYPLFIGTGMNLSQVRSEVLKELAVLLALGVPPFAALFFAALVALRRTREALESAQRLEAETQTRRRAEEALRQAQKLEAMGRLTGGVAHDFNNALMVISNNAHLLQRHVAGDGTARLQAIDRAVDSATKLTRQLLAFSRRQVLLPEVISLQEKLPTIRELIGPVLGGQISLAIEVAPDTALISVDAAELELALLNLSINARDAMPAGGAFTLRARNAATGVPARLGSTAVMVEASDSGHGIEPDLLDKVFEPFFTTKPVGHGTGLGLSQVYGFCERAGGAVTISSIVGKGTSVRMYFPPAQTRADAPPVTRTAGVRDLGKSVLVVEDNEEVAGALLPLLEALGCRAVRVGSAAAALEWLAAERHGPDVVLSDVMMAGAMDGVGLAQALRASRPELPVILMTGYAERIDEATALGFEVLPKPCSAEALGAALSRATGARLDGAAGRTATPA